MTHNTISATHAASIIRAIASVTVSAPPIQNMATLFTSALRTSIASRLEAGESTDDLLIVINSAESAAPNAKGWTIGNVQDALDGGEAMTLMQQHSCLIETVIFAQLSTVEGVLSKLDVPSDSVNGEIASEIVSLLAEQAESVADVMVGPARLALIEEYRKQQAELSSRDAALHVISMLLTEAGLTEEEIAAKLAAEGYERIGDLDSGNKAG